VGHSARRRCLTQLSAHPELDADERTSLAGVLSDHAPGRVCSETQTDLSWAEAEKRLTAALTAAVDEEVAQVAKWDKRAERRMLTQREALARLDAAREVEDDAFTPLAYRPFFGERRPPPESMPRGQLLSCVAELFADAFTDDALEYYGMEGFLTTRVTSALAAATGGGGGKGDGKGEGKGEGSGEGSGKGKGEVAVAGKGVVKTRGELSSLLFSARLQASSSQVISLFASSAGILPGADADETGGGRPVLGMLRAMYGGPPSMIQQLLPRPRVFVMMTREAADMARVNTPPAPTTEVAGEAPAMTVAWGSVHEAIRAAELPPHLEESAIAHAERQASMVDIPGVDDRRALDAEALLALVQAAWGKHRWQRANMLAERFDAHDVDGNGELGVAEFWGCINHLLTAMVRAGGENEATAEPWLETGESELLYNMVAMEADYLGMGGGSKAPTIAREPFVAVMMRRRLYDLDYATFLERHPEERVWHVT